MEERHLPWVAVDAWLSAERPDEVASRYSRRTLLAAREEVLGDVDGPHVEADNVLVGALNAVLEVETDRVVDPSLEQEMEALRRLLTSRGYRAEVLLDGLG